MFQLRSDLQSFCIFNITLWMMVLSLCTVTAQQPTVIVVEGKPVPIPAQAGQPVGAGASKPADGTASDARTGDSKPDDPQPGHDAATTGQDGKPDFPEPKVIRRDQAKAGEADPDEFKATVGDDGKVAFQFRNQPWGDLVQWLAEISDQPLDWLELPGDRVNIRSPGRYTVAEVRDLFNRHLLARGYTILEVDGGLTIAKTENINPAIVPRVDVVDLSALSPHAFVRTSMDVGWLSAESLAEELKPMISSNGRLTALKTTNRIEAMDAAVNLLQIADLLDQEHNHSSREALAPEVKLRYLPAEEAKTMLEEFLGLEKKEPVALTPQQMQMIQQQRQQNQQPPEPPKPQAEVAIVANVRQNSVIIRAPADRVAIAMEFLKRIDVPGQTMTSLSDIQNRVQVFRLASLDPEKLIEIVGEMNVLEPSTRIRADKTNNALVVSGSIADRFIINSLIKRLDGSGRSFEVLPLRRLDPVEVAESISFLMGQEKEQEVKNARRGYYYGDYGQRDQQENKKEDNFRVAANSGNRQVLLWANEQEMEEVRSLLIKLGELPSPGGNRQTVRTIDASATPETYEYLQRLKQQWSRVSPNPLELPDVKEFDDPNVAPDPELEPVQEQPESKPRDSDDDETIARAGNLLSSDQQRVLRLAVIQTEQSDPQATFPDEREISFGGRF